MTFGSPNTKIDTTLKGDDALWAQADYYMANKDDHAMLFEREFFREIVPFLFRKASLLREVDMEAPAVMELRELRMRDTYVLVIGALVGLFAGAVFTGVAYQNILSKERAATAQLMQCDPGTNESTTIYRDAAGKLHCERRQMKQRYFMPSMVWSNPLEGRYAKTH